MKLVESIGKRKLHRLNMQPIIELLKDGKIIEISGAEFKELTGCTMDSEYNIRSLISNKSSLAHKLGLTCKTMKNRETGVIMLYIQLNNP